MAYLVHKGKPYFFNGKNIYNCSVSADSVNISFDTKVKEKIKPDCLFTEDEVRHKLGITMIDGWDEKQGKVIKVSNKVVSSIPIEKKK